MTALPSREPADRHWRRPAGTSGPGDHVEARGRSPGAGFSESLDRDGAVVRCTGHLSEQGADLVRGAVEALHREGYVRVAVDLHAVRTAEAEALAELRCLSRDMRELRNVVVVLLGHEEIGW